MAKKDKLPSSDHNRKAMIHETVTIVEEQMFIKAKADRVIKDALAQAKKEGILKKAIREGVKERARSEAQSQAHLEEQRATDEVLKACKDLPLFSAANLKEVA